MLNQRHDIKKTLNKFITIITITITTTTIIVTYNGGLDPLVANDFNFI